jgi:hypothetical protein
MKTLVKAISTSVLIVAGIVVSGTALAQHHGGHSHFSFSFGVPLFGPAYYPYYAPPYYYPPYYPPAAMPASPPVYVEQGSTQPAPAPGPSSDGWWYYCAESKTYYPYVKECPGGWQRVSPQASNDR